MARAEHERILDNDDAVIVGLTLIDDGDPGGAGRNRKGEEKRTNTHVVAYRRPAISFPDTVFGDRMAQAGVRPANLSQTRTEDEEMGRSEAGRTRSKRDISTTQPIITQWGRK